MLKADPDVAAIHFQEIGGKEYKMCMPKVKKFVRLVVTVLMIHMLLGNAT